jgi:hypothetical protein
VRSSEELDLDLEPVAPEPTGAPVAARTMSRHRTPGAP